MAKRKKQNVEQNQLQEKRRKVVQKETNPQQETQTVEEQKQTKINKQIIKKQNKTQVVKTDPTSESLEKQVSQNGVQQHQLSDHKNTKQVDNKNQNKNNNSDNQNKIQSDDCNSNQNQNNNNNNNNNENSLGINEYKQNKIQDGDDNNDGGDKGDKNDGEGKEEDVSNFVFKNKERVLVMSSRGVNFRFRHVMMDFIQLLPHSKKDVKLDVKKDKTEVTEIADMRGCTSALVFEGRKRRDMYLWVAKLPMGPTASFLASNIHTMAELKLSGNHLKGSRPVLSFDPKFDELPFLQVLKEIFIQIFATPKRHYKSKPFTDHTVTFSFLDDRVWIRNYQLITQPKADTKTPKMDELELVEVGPRVCMLLDKIFAGPFRGQILYENPRYVSPNKVRAAMKKKRGTQDKYKIKVEAKKARKKRLEDPQRQMPIDEINKVFKG